MYEGAPDWPERDRFWRSSTSYGVTMFYTAPTAIRAFMKWGPEHPGRHDLSTLRLLGTVGEPINPEAWMWYHEHIGPGTLSHRRYLVADRDRRNHDHAAARRDHHQAGLGDAPLSRHLRRAGGRQGKRDRDGRRVSDPHRAMARDAPDHLRRR